MIAFALAILFLAITTPAHATRYWVATTGSDANACASIDGDADPGVYKASVQSAEACLSSGDTLTIKGGTYNATSARIRNIPSGTVGNPTIIEGDPSDSEGCAITSTCSTILKPTGTNTNSLINGVSHVIIRKIDFDHQGVSNNSYPLRIMGTCTDVLIEDVELHSTLISTSGGASGIMVEYYCTFVTLRRIHSHDNGSTLGSHHGAYIQGDDVTIEHSWFHDNGNGGLQFYNSWPDSDGRADRAILRYSIVEDNVVGPGVAAESNDCVIHNNIIRRNGSSSGAGIALGYGGSLRCQVFNNVIYANASGSGTGLIFGNYGSASNGSAKNNIIFGHATEVLVNANSTGVTLSHNACSASDSCGSTSKLTISAITACTVSTTDFTQKAGSSCIDTGTSVGLAYNGSAPDIGPHETFTFASCEVPSDSTSSIRITFNNNLHPPLQTPTTFTARKNGSSNVLSGAATVVGDNVVNLPLTDSYAGGDTADISWSSGSLSDSALIGGTSNQPFLTILSNQSCTNNAAGAPSFTLTQADFEYHGVYGLEASPDVRGAENATTYTVVKGGAARIRISVVCAVADCAPVGLYLYYAQGGAYAVVPNEFASGNVAFCGSTYTGSLIPSNGAVTTNQLSTSGTFVAGGVIFSSQATPTVTLDNGNKTELEYCVRFDTDATGDYTFRLYNQEDYALSTYSHTPTVTVISAQALGGM